MSKLPQGVDFTEADLYGQRHPIENDQLIVSKLKEFEDEVDKIPEAEKGSLLQAQSNCPSLLSDDFKLMFLRCEIFNADLAARRYVKYWEQRLHVFGPEKAFLPLTLDGALKDDEVALTIGFMNYTGQFDPSGRALPFADPSKQDKTKYTQKSMCRALWYLLHTCLQNTETQKKGVIVCIFPRNVRLGQLDRKLMKLNSDSLKACIPVRVSCLHICHPPKIFQMVFPIVKFFLGERLQKRVKIHSGSDEQVLTELEKYGLTKDMVASPIGGNAEVDMAKYIAECRKAGK